MKFTPNLTRSELKTGLIVIPVCMFLLPGLLALTGINAILLNFASYFISAAAAVYVLRGFLLRNLKAALIHPFRSFYCGCLGYAAEQGLGYLAVIVMYALVPDFVNLNDAAIMSRFYENFGLMVLVAVVLAPITEECLFRGLLFRGLYDRSPVLAWTLSMGLFAAVHVTGYIGSYAPLEILAAFVQYLPAGVAMCIAYQRGGNICCPILTHMLTNLMALYTLVL